MTKKKLWIDTENTKGGEELVIKNVFPGTALWGVMRQVDSEGTVQNNPVLNGIGPESCGAMPSDDMMECVEDTLKEVGETNEKITFSFSKGPVEEWTAEADTPHPRCASTLPMITEYIQVCRKHNSCAGVLHGFQGMKGLKKGTRIVNIGVGDKTIRDLDTDPFTLTPWMIDMYVTMHPVGTVVKLSFVRPRSETVEVQDVEIIPALSEIEFLNYFSKGLKSK